MTRPIRLLLVEDNPGDAELTRDTLEGGTLPLQVTVATTGVEAMERLTHLASRRAEDLPDLILLDLNLPLMDGREVLAEIRKREELRKIPVVILTSSDAEKDIAKSYQLGANCYVTKPVGLKEFRTIVQTVERFWFTVAKLP